MPESLISVGQIQAIATKAWEELFAFSCIHNDYQLRYGGFRSADGRSQHGPLRRINQQYGYGHEPVSPGGIGAD